MRQFFTGMELLNSEKLALKRKVQQSLLVDEIGLLTRQPETCGATFVLIFRVDLG